jgi:hypothetical protein
VPDYLVAFNDLSRASDPSKCGVHFFKHDEKFLPHLENPAAFSNRYSNFKVVLCPDVSIGSGMPFWMRMKHTFDSRATGITWQKYGHVVIPTLRWTGEEDYEFVSHGIPKCSVFAVSRLGSVHDPLKRSVFDRGLVHMTRLLEPEAILVYGTTTEQVQSVLGDVTQIFAYPVLMRAFSNSHKMEGKISSLSPLV